MSWALISVTDLVVHALAIRLKRRCRRVLARRALVGRGVGQSETDFGASQSRLHEQKGGEGVKGWEAAEAGARRDVSSGSAPLPLLPHPRSQSHMGTIV